MCEARLQFPVGLCHWKLRELLGKVIRRTEKEPRVCFSQHGSVVVGIACSQDVKDYLLQRSRPVLFSTSHPPSVVATCIAALDLLESDNSLVERLWKNTRFFKRGLEQLGFNTGHSETPITPVIVGEGALAMKFSNRLFEEGVFAQGIVFPTVPVDKCRVRTIVTALHTREELSKALSIFEKVGKELNII